jgi:hypothetical protein
MTPDRILGNRETLRYSAFRLGGEQRGVDRLALGVRTDGADAWHGVRPLPARSRARCGGV